MLHVTGHLHAQMKRRDPRQGKARWHRHGSCRIWRLLERSTTSLCHGCSTGTFYQEWLQEQETQALSEEAWKPIQVMAEERKANQWHDQEWWWRSERGLSQAQEDWWRQRWNQQLIRHMRIHAYGAMPRKAEQMVLQSAQIYPEFIMTHTCASKRRSTFASGFGEQSEVSEAPSKKTVSESTCWNAANPREAVRPEDCIVQVQDVGGQADEMCAAIKGAANVEMLARASASAEVTARQVLASPPLPHPRPIRLMSLRRNGGALESPSVWRFRPTRSRMKNPWTRATNDQ